MANLTLEQQRALALANARLRLQQQAQPKPVPKKPEETGFLEDVKDTAIKFGKATIDIAKPFAYMAESALPYDIAPKLARAVLGKSEEFLQGARSAGDIELERQQQAKSAAAALAPGSLAKGIASARTFIEGRPRPEQARSVLSDIADTLSPARVIAKALPATPGEAQREITSVTSQFASPKEAAGFVASQLPATLATILTGGAGRSAALASGLERTAASKIGERVAVATGTTLNSVDAGYSAAQDVLSKGGTKEEANRAFAVAAGGAAIASSVASKLPGVEQNVFSTKAVVPGVIRGAVRSAAGEAPQEFIEEAGSQLSQNVAKLGTAAETPISEGVLSSGALGAIGGAGIGAPVGAVEGFTARGEAPPAGEVPPSPPGTEPLRTTTVSYPNREDPTAPITRTLDVMSEPDDQGYITVRDDTGKSFEMKAADLDEMEAATPAYAPSTETEAATPPAPTVDAATNLERLRLASGVAEGVKEHPRVRALAKDVTEALAADDPVAAQQAVQKRADTLATSRMSETTKAQRQAELDEAQSIINDYRVEYARALSTGPATVTAPTVEPSSIEQALEQNAALSEEDAKAEALRAAEERLRLASESEFETASNIGQGSPVNQAQAERQQLFQSIIEDESIPNPAGAFRQALRDRGYPNVELNESERRQLQARRAFTKPANIVPFTGETVEPEVVEPAPTPTAAEPIEAEFTEVPAELPPAPPEVVAGAAVAPPSRRAQLMAGTAPAAPTVPGVAFGEDPAPRPMRGAPSRQGEAQRGAPTKPERMAAAQQLMDILAQFGFKDIKVVVKDMLVDSKGELAKGLFRPVDSLILVAMSDPGSMSSTTFHELIHYLKDRGFFTDTEWAAIVKYAKRDLITRGITEYAYKGDSRADRDEEIVAEAFRNWADIATGGRPSNNIFAKIQRLLNSIRDFFFKQNMLDAQAVFNAIINGEFAAREAQPSARMAEAEARGSVPSERPIYAGRSIARGRVYGGAVESKIISQNLNTAEDMESAGADPNEIRVATGWERNPYDNEWRYLQADDMASETPILDDLIRDYDYAELAYNTATHPDGSFDLGDLMRHSELYSIYPDARSIRVTVKKSGGGQLQGSFDPDTDHITLYADAVDPLGTLLHEVQHWVQKKEGFAFGSSPSTVWKALSEKQKREEAQTAVDVLNLDIDDLSQVSDVLAYLNSSPEFRMALADGTALSDLDGFFAQAFEDDVIVDDRIYAIVQERLNDIVSDQADLGLAEPRLTSEDVLNELNDVSEEIVEKTQLIEDIKDGDPAEEGSPAEEAARTAFEDHTRRNVIRYIDTAGEIEARDVSAQRRKSREQLLSTGMLASEKAPRPGSVVITRAGRSSAASEQQKPVSADAATKGAKLGFLANMRNFMSDLYRKHLYKYSGALKLDEKLANALGVKTLPKQMSLEDRASMYETMRSGLLRDFNRMWFNPFKVMMKALGIDPQDLSMYLWARSAPARNALVAERNRDMPDGGSGMMNLEAEAVMSFYKASGMMRKMEPLIAFHDRLVDWTLKQRVKAGLMSQEEADLLRKDQPFYTPLKGFAAAGDMFAAGDEDPHEGYKGQVQLGVRPKDYIKATGRASMPFDPMSNLISDAMQLTQRIAKNEVGKRFLSIIRDFPDLLGNAVKVYTDDKPKIVNKGVAAPGSKKKTVGPMNMAANANKFLVVKDSGKNFYIEFNEKTHDGEQMKRMFDNMTPKELEGAIKFLTKLGSFKKQLLTRFSATFWPINFLRDIQDAVITAYSEQTRIGSPVEGKKVALRTAANLVRPSVWRAVGQYMSGHDPVKSDDAENVLLVSQMVQDGGEAGRQFVLDAETIAADIKKDLDLIKSDGAKGIWGAADSKRRALVRVIDNINEYLSLVPRFAAYKAAIDQNVSPDDAAKFALDSTLNLARKGEASQVVDNIWLFSNPAAQSLEKKKRIYASKNGRKAMALMMGLGVGLHFFNMMMAGDDDDDGENDYQEMDELTKMSNLVIYTGDGPPIKLPVGFMVGFETYLGQQIARMMTNDGSGIGILEAAGNALSAFFATQIPAGEKIGSITDVPKLAVPDVFTPAVDLWRNKNVFDGQIYPEPYYEGQAVSGMARRSTGEFYKSFAQGLNRLGGGTEDIASGMDTPAEAWQYLINQNLLVGGAGLPREAAKYFEEGAPADVTKVPVVKRFVGDNREFSAQNKYYDRAKKVEVIAGQYEGQNADADAYAESQEKFPVASDPSVIEAFKEANKALRELSKEKRQAQRDGGADLDEVLKDIENRQREEYVKFNTVYNEVKRGQ